MGCLLLLCGQLSHVTAPLTGSWYFPQSQKKIHTDSNLSSALLCLFSEFEKLNGISLLSHHLDFRLIFHRG